MAGGAGHVPGEEYPVEYREEESTKTFKPSKQDKWVQPEDYELSDPQLGYEIKKAYKEGDEQRVAALKIVKALRQGEVGGNTKKPHSKGNMGFASSWIEEA